MRLKIERVLNHNIHLVVVVSGWIPERDGEKSLKTLHYSWADVKQKSIVILPHLYSAEKLFCLGDIFLTMIGHKKYRRCCEDMQYHVTNTTNATKTSLERPEYYVTWTHKHLKNFTSKLKIKTSSCGEIALK